MVFSFFFNSHGDEELILAVMGRRGDVSVMRGGGDVSIRWEFVKTGGSIVRRVCAISLEGIVLLCPVVVNEREDDDLLPSCPVSGNTFSINCFEEIVEHFTFIELVLLYGGVDFLVGDGWFDAVIFSWRY